MEKDLLTKEEINEALSIIQDNIKSGILEFADKSLKEIKFPITISILHKYIKKEDDKPFSYEAIYKQVVNLQDKGYLFCFKDVELQGRPVFVIPLYNRKWEGYIAVLKKAYSMMSERADFKEALEKNKIYDEDIKQVFEKIKDPKLLELINKANKYIEENKTQS